jgi:hypothetical protein
VELDLNVVEDLAKIHCTEAEIAAFFGVSPELLRRRKHTDPEFCGALEKGRDQGKTSLRRLQWKAAMGGNITMLIWLGKQLLGQTDRHGIEHSGAEDRPPVRIVEIVMPGPAPGEETARATSVGREEAETDA